MGFGAAATGFAAGRFMRFMARKVHVLRNVELNVVTEELATWQIIILAMLLHVATDIYIYIYIDIHTYPGYQTQKVEGGTPLTMQYATSSVVTQWLQRPPSFLHLDIMIL